MKHLFILLSFLPAWAMALTIQPGQPLPQVEIRQAGELELNNNEITYQPWSSQELSGKVRLIHAIAGRSSAKKLNAPMIEAVKQAKFAEQSYQTVTVVNLNDAMFGTSGLVKSKLKKNKQQFPHASFVLDEAGALFEQWQLKSKSSAIILVDAKGKVIFAKEGELQADEIKQVLALIKENI
ncbi:YtfJ family protein [Agarivorans sp.]|uniref:YtfJ family protein n=1 Tax=Agarivorans sp. TaxID=1872412 RepID=UPI003CFDB87F